MDIGFCRGTGTSRINDAGGAIRRPARLLQTGLTYSKLFERDLCRSKLFLRCRFRFPIGSALLFSQAFNPNGSFLFHYSGHDRSAVAKVLERSQAGVSVSLEIQTFFAVRASRLAAGDVLKPCDTRWLQKIAEEQRSHLKRRPALQLPKKARPRPSMTASRGQSS